MYVYVYVYIQAIYMHAWIWSTCNQLDQKAPEPVVLLWSVSRHVTRMTFAADLSELGDPGTLVHKDMDKLKITYEPWLIITIYELIIIWINC